MRTWMRLMFVVAALAVALPMTGCKKEEPKKTPGQTIGDAVDKGIEKTGEAVEKTGEAVEEAGEKIQDEAEKK